MSSAPPAPAGTAGRRRPPRTFTPGVILVLLIVLAGVAGAIYYGLQHQSEDAKKAPGIPVTTPDGAIVTTPMGSIVTMQPTTSTTIVITGSAEEFCGYGQQFRDAVGLYGKAAAAKSAAEAETLSKEATPLFDQVLQAAPAEVYQQVRAIRGDNLKMATTVTIPSGEPDPSNAATESRYRAGLAGGANNANVQFVNAYLAACPKN